MSKKSNQHYVPQFYFRLFSNDGKSICVFNRKNGKSCPSASIKGQASKHKFYGSEEIEDAFSNLEGIFSGPLRLLKSCSDLRELSEADYLLTLQAIMFQRARTLAARNSSHPMNDRLTKLWLEAEINKNEDLSDEQKHEFISSLDLFEIDPLRFHLEQIKISIEQADLLSDLIPVLLDNRTNRPFIFSDSPAVFHNSYYGNVKLRGVLGFTTPGLQIFFPLCEKRTLLLVDPQRYSVKRIRDGNMVHVRDLQDVAAINKLQIHSATTAIYFSDYKYADYVTSIWAQENKKLSENLVNVIEAPSFDYDGTPRGDIVHSFAPTLPINLKLSFLEHEVLGDNDYDFSERSAYV
ncbi:DUF4238 domain-containing protein [Pseudomonas cavernicola]|uniref:DUF4238 domain-containing protein n=1 Tax=Pseudomonas cavernicola TaxID=2320866 RepID=A0A418XKR4_9PSED|nr:DUF4238 domain-containing protein [Pseudomonas cavernicola]RJG13026.1 DUF4238 domain-containing protein [Pseudomonas cavernicola]